MMVLDVTRRKVTGTLKLGLALVYVLRVYGISAPTKNPLVVRLQINVFLTENLVLGRQPSEHTMFAFHLQTSRILVSSFPIRLQISNRF